METPLILALDIGTSSVRAALYDHAGNVLPETMVKNERVLTATEDGGAEIDAVVGFKQIVAAVDDVLHKSRSVKGDVTHVAISSFWHSLVGVDASGKPTTAVLSWADTAKPRSGGRASGETGRTEDPQPMRCEVPFQLLAG